MINGDGVGRDNEFLLVNLRERYIDIVFCWIWVFEMYGWRKVYGWKKQFGWKKQLAGVWVSCASVDGSRGSEKFGLCCPDV